MAHILVIEDNTTMREGVVQVLSTLGHDVYGAHDGKEGIAYFNVTQPDLVITDLKMEGMDGMQVLKEVKDQAPDMLVLMITAFGTIELAVEAMQLGAFDFIPKPFPPDLLRVKVKKALDVIQTKAENQYLRQEQMKKVSTMLIGQSKAMKSIHHQIEKAAPSDAAVLITGEGGTGKDLLARTIHQLSFRKNKPFIKMDCSSMSELALESELFGYERGSFTGANQRKQGRFELADGGTLFLDEVGEIPDSLQAKLHRVLQDRNFERAGGTKTISTDVRIISATHHNLKKMVEEGRFRQDLYFRLNIVSIELPPLRNRKEDIEVLLDFFLLKQNQKLKKQIKLSNEAKEVLIQYPWPGNIRELENAMERLMIGLEAEEIAQTDIPQEIRKNAIIRTDLEESQSQTLEEALENLEKRMILKAYEECHGVKSKMAKKLGVKTSALYYKMEKYGIS